MATWAERIERGLVHISAVTRLEIGFSARTGNQLREGLRTPPLAAMPVEYLTPAIEDRAVELQALLADRGHHRAPAVPDLLIAAHSRMLCTLAGRVRLGRSAAGPTGASGPHALRAEASSADLGGRRPACVAHRAKRTPTIAVLRASSPPSTRCWTCRQRARCSAVLARGGVPGRRSPAATALAHRSMAATVRSTSSSSVAQSATEMRISRRPRQVVPLT